MWKEKEKKEERYITVYKVYKPLSVLYILLFFAGVLVLFNEILFSEFVAKLNPIVLKVRHIVPPFFPPFPRRVKLHKLMREFD